MKDARQNDLLEDDDGGHETDTKSSNKTAGHEEPKGCRRGLQDDTDNEDEATNDDGCSATKEISEIARNDGTEECARRENGGDQGFLPRGKAETVFGSGGGIQPGESMDEVGHAHHTADVSRVVSEEYTTKRSKGTHHVGLERDRRLNALNVGRSRKGSLTTRHDEEWKAVGLSEKEVESV